ncbi:HlyD family secretion protein [Lacunimicrobium album]
MKTKTDEREVTRRELTDVELSQVLTRPGSTMLQPVAYDETLMPTLRLARSSQKARRIANVLMWSLIVTMIFVVFAPWQQSVKGTGNVIAFSPTERPQTMQATIKGRIVRWGHNIFENAQVEKGQFIAEIQDLDPDYVTRLNDQLNASKSVVEAAKKVLEANEQNLVNAKQIERIYFQQIERYRTIRSDTLDSANALIEMTKKKVDAAEQEYSEAVTAKEQIDLEFQRDQLLYRDGIYNDEYFQVSQRKMKEAGIKVDKAATYIQIAKEDLNSKMKDRDVKLALADIDIDYALGMVQKAQSDIAKASSEVSKARSEVNKAQKDLTESEIKTARQQSQVLNAPFDGTIVKITPNQGAAILKEGDPICVIVPETANRSVEVYLKGNDAPLVDVGRHVRLQFEGWPAIQFSGWPQVAVGTFGGTVISVDETDDGMGRFRVLVAPDETTQEWPEPRFLRQGVRVNGWVLLDTVPLWYEIWRNLNGFPPSIQIEKDGKIPKAPKLPKV